MGSKSDIEWTDASWTPIRARNLKTGKVGWHCEHATTGCEFCYAETLNKRLGSGLPFKPGHRSDIEIFLDPQMLLAPLKWKKPRMIFVCSMTDLFADFVPDEWIDQVFAVMALCPQHTFQVLTKRAERMRDYFAPTGCVNCGDGQLDSKCCDEPYVLNGDAAFRDAMIEGAAQALYAKLHPGDDPSMWLSIHMPLDNVWLGVSTERQKEADERIPLLLQTPAAVRFISAEPLLGHIDLHALNLSTPTPCNALRGVQCVPDDSREGFHNEPMNKLDWVIVGGESGKGARPMHPDWARSIRDWCQAAGVPFFFKQFGEWMPCAGDEQRAFSKVLRGNPDNHESAWPDGTVGNGHKDRNGGFGYPLLRVGKKAAGRLLDGKTHDAIPSPPDHVIKPPARRAAGE